MKKATQRFDDPNLLRFTRDALNEGKLLDLSDRKIVRTLIWLALNGNRDDRLDAAELLGDSSVLRSKAISTLEIGLLKENTGDAKVYFAESLGILGSRNSWKLLARFLGHPCSLLRAHCAIALCRAIPSHGKELVAKQLKREHSPLAQVHMLAALYRGGRDTLYSELIRRLKSRSYLVRLVAANGIRDGSTLRKARPEIVTALRDALKTEEVGSVKSALRQALNAARK